MHQAEQVGLHYFVKPVPDLELSLDHLEIFLFFFFFLWSVMLTHLKNIEKHKRLQEDAKRKMKGTETPLALSDINEKL